MQRHAEDTLWNWLGRSIPWREAVGNLETRHGISIGIGGQSVIRVSEADSPMPAWVSQPYAYYSEKLPVHLPPVKWGCDLLHERPGFQFETVKEELQRAFGKGFDHSVGNRRACLWTFGLASLDLIFFPAELNGGREIGWLEIDAGYRRELSDQEFAQIERVTKTALWFPRKSEDFVRRTSGFFEITPLTTHIEMLRRSPMATKGDEIRFGVPPENDTLIGLAGFEALFVPLVNIENLQLDMDVVEGVETHTLSVRFRPERPECILLRSTLEDLSAVATQIAKLIGRPLTSTSSRD